MKAKRKKSGGPPYRGHVSVSAIFYKALVERAERDGVTIASIVERAVEQAMAEHQP